MQPITTSLIPLPEEEAATGANYYLELDGATWRHFRMTYVGERSKVQIRRHENTTWIQMRFLLELCRSPHSHRDQAGHSQTTKQEELWTRADFAGP